MFERTLPLPNQGTVISGRQIFSAGHAEAQGIRPSMEDAMAMIGEFAGAGTQFFGVYDGHGGREVADYLANNLHRVLSTKLRGINPQNKSTQNGKYVDEVSKAIIEAFSEVDTYTSHRWMNCGSTAAIVIILGDDIWVANAGDARVVLSENGKFQRLTVDHKPSLPEERAEIVKRGGLVVQGRVNGVLAVSRAFGDGSFKPFISAVPYIKHIRRTNNSYLILACDGVWDVMDDSTAAQFVETYKNPASSSRQIVNEALRRGTTDNVSVAVVSLSPK